MTQNQEKFDSSWRAACTIEEVSIATLRPLIAQHYLQKAPAIPRCCLAMFYGATIVGMVIYADAPKETSKRYGGYTWELARLWISDMIPRNAETWLIGKSVKHVKRKYPDVKFLVSYADPSAGHAGTIYKAANWKFDGMTDEGRKTPRADYVDEKGKKYSRKSHVPEGTRVTRQYRVSKHRFYYPL